MRPTDDYEPCIKLNYSKLLYYAIIFLLAFLVLLMSTTELTRASRPYSDPLSPENVIYKPTIEVSSVRSVELLPSHSTSQSIRASNTISEEALRQYLSSKNSPLVSWERQILDSPYWSTIIAITAAEQSFYKQPASSPYNLWGRMYPRCCILKKYPDFPTAIADMDTYFRDYWEAKGVTTIEGLNGRYVVPASVNWQATVLRTKSELESLQ